MKSIIIKARAAIAIGLITATTAATATPDVSSNNSSPAAQQAPMHKVVHGTATVAKTTWHGTRQVDGTTMHQSKGMAQATWDESRKVARTVVYSPVIGYEVMRGERPLFPHYTASREQGRREQIALTGHRTDQKSRTESDAPKQAEPPI